MSSERRFRHPLIGLASLLVFAVLVGLAIASYNQEFVSSEPITIKSQRSGLLMDPGAAVKLRGVVVGRVGTVVADGDGAVLTADLDPELIDQVPANVSARIVPPTMFGSKYVKLVPPAGGPAGSLRPGAVLDDSRVTVEINDTFAEVMRTLQALQPARLNAMLTSVANTLDGKGVEVGRLIRDANAYLERINPSLPALRADIGKTIPVANDYTAITPDLVRTADNAGSISTTIADQRAQLAAFLLSMTHLGDDMSTFLDNLEEPLVTTLAVLEPSLRLVAEYSPELPCLFGGIVENDRLLSAVMGGPEFGGTHRNANVTMTLGRGMGPYRYPRDLPKVNATGGPDCHGLPVVDKLVPYVKFDTGADPYRSQQEGIEAGEVPIGVLLFGEQIPAGGER